MRIFNDMKLVEQLGSGIPRILEFYGRECFQFLDNYRRMSFLAEKKGNMAKLKELGLIEYTGSTKKDHWKLLKNK